MGYLAGTLKDKNYDVRIVDLANKQEDKDQRIKDALEWNPDIVGFTIKTNTLKSAQELVKIFKIHNQNIVTFAGGPHVTLNDIKFMEENPYFDYGLFGESEETFLELLHYLKKSGDLNKVKGICYRSKNRIIKTKPREFISDLDKLPMPDYTVFDSVIKKENGKYQLPPHHVYQIFTSRGCPYACTFCSNVLIWKQKFRLHSSERVVEEIKKAVDLFEIKAFEIQDDNFTLNKERAIKICDAIVPFKLEWKIPNGVRADQIDDELLLSMKKSGCKALAFGIESADPEVLKNIKKSESIQVIEKAIKLAKKHGFFVSGHFIIGLTGSNFDKEMKSIKFAKRLKLDNATFYPANPETGTEFKKWVDKNTKPLSKEILTKLKTYPFINRPLDDMDFETEEFPWEKRIKIFYIANLRFNPYGLFRSDKPIKSTKEIIGLIWKYDKKNFPQDSYIFLKKILPKFLNKSLRKLKISNR